MIIVIRYFQLSAVGLTYIAQAPAVDLTHLKEEEDKPVGVMVTELCSLLAWRANHATAGGGRGNTEPGMGAGAAGGNAVNFKKFKKV